MMNRNLTDCRWIALATLCISLSSALAVQADDPSKDEPAAKTSDEKQSTTKEKTSKKEKEPTQEFKAYEGRLQFTAPASWKLVKPKINMIDIELSIPPADVDQDSKTETETDVPHGRMTMMSAGGEVDANIRRWIGQFRLAKDDDGKDKMVREERKVDGGVVHTLDVAGTYFDRPRGPFGPKLERADYRMLAAIIEVKGAGKFFVKFYGPEKLVERNQKAFDKMLSEIKFGKPESSEPEPKPSPKS